MRKYEDLVVRVQRHRKEDLQLVSAQIDHTVLLHQQCRLISPLGQPNHLLGYRREYVALYFRNQQDLFTVRRELLPIATKNREMLDAVDTYAEVVVNSEHMFDMDLDIEEYGGEGNGKSKSRSFAQAGAGAGPQGAASDSILDIREYDVPYYLRVAIDKREC